MPAKPSSVSGGAVTGARLVLAVLLGAGAFVLLFALGEGVSIPDSVPGSDYLKMGILVCGMAGYFVIAQFLLSRDHPQAVRRDWPLVLGLNLWLILLWLAILVRGPVLKTLASLAAVAFTVGCSFAGAAGAARNARRDQQRDAAQQRPALSGPQ